MLHTDLCYSNTYEPDLDFFFLGVYVVVVDGRHLWVFIALPSPSKSIKFSLFSITTHIKEPFWLSPPFIFTRQGHESL